MTLNLGDRQLILSDARRSSGDRLFTWSPIDPGWSIGQQIAVSIRN